MRAEIFNDFLTDWHYTTHTTLHGAHWAKVSKEKAFICCPTRICCPGNWEIRTFGSHRGQSFLLESNRKGYNGPIGPFWVIRLPTHTYISAVDFPSHEVSISSVWHDGDDHLSNFGLISIPPWILGAPAHSSHNGHQRHFSTGGFAPTIIS